MKYVLSGCLALLSVGAAQAGGLLVDMGGEAPCFGRVYDAAHLASHSEQRVQSIWLTDVDDSTRREEYRLQYTFRDGEVYESYVYCDRQGDEMDCGVEGDGGSFMLSAQGQAIRLEVGEYLSIEGATDTPDLAQSDDRVFLLYPVERNCPVQG